nr:MAK10-like protein [Tanacetum cinerariifolium]
MSDKNPICTLRDYFKPSYEGYWNTIELPVRNNVVPLRSDTIRLVKNECSFHRLWSEDPNQHLKDFLKLVDSLDLDVTNRERTHVPSTSDRCLIELKNQVQCLMEAHLAPTQPTQVNKITSSCEICTGPHDTQYCMENPKQAFVEYASSRNNIVGNREFTTNQGPRNFKEAIDTWKDKPNFNWEQTQTFTSPPNGLISTRSSNYLMKLKKALIDFDSHQEKRLYSLRTQLGQQQQHDMIRSPKAQINFTLPTNIQKKSSEEDEDKKEGSVKSGATEYKSSETIDEIEYTVESIEEVEEETKEEEDGDPKHFDTFPIMNELRYHEWILKNPRPPWVKAKIRIKDVNNVKFSGMIGQFNKEQAYLDLKSPLNIMSRLYYNWIMTNRLELKRKLSNPKKNYNFVRRVRKLKVFLGNFTYEYDFMVLEDTTSVIDHYLGSVVFRKPFVKATGLVYNKEEGTLVFKRDKEKIIFKLPHKIDMFKHIDFVDMSTDCISPFIVQSDDDNCEKTHYSDSLDLGPEYTYDEYVCRGI